MSKENKKHKNKTSNNCKKEKLKKQQVFQPPPWNDSDQEISDTVESTGEEEGDQAKGENKVP